MAADSAFVHCDDEESFHCEYCVMLLNRPTQWKDHKIGFKHKKNLRASAGAEEKKKAKDKGIVILQDIALLIEQSALFDAVASYIRNLSLRAMLRSKL